MVYRQVRPFRIWSCSRYAVLYCGHPHRSPASADAGATASSSLGSPVDLAYPAVAATRLLPYPDGRLLILLSFQCVPQSNRLAERQRSFDASRAQALVLVGLCVDRRNLPETERSVEQCSSRVWLDAHALELCLFGAHSRAPVRLCGLGGNRATLAAPSRLRLETPFAGGPR